MTCETPGADLVEDHLNSLASSTVNNVPLPLGQFPKTWLDNLAARLDAITPGFLKERRSAKNLLIMNEKECGSNDPDAKGRIFTWNRKNDGWEFLHCERFPDRLTAVWQTTATWPTLVKCFYRVLQYCKQIGDSALLEIIYADERQIKELHVEMGRKEFRETLGSIKGLSKKVFGNTQTPIQVALTHPVLTAYVDISKDGSEQGRDIGLIASQLHDKQGIQSLVADMMKLTSRYSRHLPRSWTEQSMSYLFKSEKEERGVNVLQHKEHASDVHALTKNGNGRKRRLGEGFAK